MNCCDRYVKVEDGERQVIFEPENITPFRRRGNDDMTELLQRNGF